VDEYLANLVNALRSSYSITSKKITINMNIEKMSVLFDIAIPCGIIITELLSNSLKHAFPDEMPGVIEIRFARSDKDELVLEINDNGVGVPERFNFETSQTLGLSLVKTIVRRQLHGSLSFYTDHGVRCIIHFEDTIYKERV
jgi:two-component sensor histidine kinase